MGLLSARHFAVLVGGGVDAGGNVGMRFGKIFQMCPNCNILSAMSDVTNAIQLHVGKLRVIGKSRANFTQTSHLDSIREYMMRLPLRGEPISVPFTGRRLLERALVVVRFTPVLKIAEESGNGISEFQESIRQHYPLAELEREAVMRIEVKPDGSIGAKQEEQPVWRLSDIEKAWRLSLTPRSIALETSGETYKNWPDFAKRISSLVDAVGVHFAPSHRQYIGVRYINAAPVDNGADPRRDCAKELVSITGDPGLELADLLWRFSADEGHLQLRSGVMPPNSSYDPNVFVPRQNSTWYLDIDVSNTDSNEFDASQINASILSQVRRLHAIYLWAMQDKGKAAK